MVHVRKYHLPPTPLTPNSPLPLLHYPGLLAPQTSPAADAALRVHDLFTQNGWQTQWVHRYGPTQQAHYHATVHEAMAVLCGEATIRFGASDAEMRASSETEGVMGGGGGGRTTTTTTTTTGPGGGSLATTMPPTPPAPPATGSPPLEIHARAGDVFILPAGVSHKTFDTVPSMASKMLSPGNGHGLVAAAAAASSPLQGQGGNVGNSDSSDSDSTSSSSHHDPRQSLANLEVDGFTMIGAYPLGSGEWDFNLGGEHQGKYAEIWNVAKPGRDPVLGEDPDGLCGLWRD